MGTLASLFALLASAATASPAVADTPTGATTSAPLYHELPASPGAEGRAAKRGDPLAFPSYDFNTPSNTTVIGFEPDLDQALSKLLGVPFVLHIAQFPQLVLGVASHRFDIAIDGVSDSRAREKQVDFVDYGQAALVILTPASRAPQVKSVASICGNTLAYAQGTYGQQTAQDITLLCKQRHLPRAKVVQFPDAPSIQLALESGRIASSLRTRPPVAGTCCSPRARSPTSRSPALPTASTTATSPRSSSVWSSARASTSSRSHSVTASTA